MGETSRGLISNSYATGAVLANERSGGLLGGFPENREQLMEYVQGSFWDVQTSRQDTTFGGTGKTTAEMKSLATYTKKGSIGLKAPWDFAGNPGDDTASQDEWAMADTINGGYPYLKRIQDKPGSIAIHKAMAPIPGRVRIYAGPGMSIIVETQDASFVDIAVFDLAGKKVMERNAIPDDPRTRHSLSWKNGQAAAIPAFGNFFALAKVKSPMGGPIRKYSALLCLSGR